MYLLSWFLLSSLRLLALVTSSVELSSFEQSCGKDKQLNQTNTNPWLSSQPASSVYTCITAGIRGTHVIPSGRRVVFGGNRRTPGQRSGQSRARWYRRRSRWRRQLWFGSPSRPGLVSLVEWQQSPFLYGPQWMVRNLVFFLRIEVREFVGDLLLLLLFQFVDAFSHAQCWWRSDKKKKPTLET